MSFVSLNAFSVTQPKRKKLRPVLLRASPLRDLGCGTGFAEAWFSGDFKNGNEAVRYLWWFCSRGYVPVTMRVVYALFLGPLRSDQGLGRHYEFPQHAERLREDLMDRFAPARAIKTLMAVPAGDYLDVGIKSFSQRVVLILVMSYDRHDPRDATDPTDWYRSISAGTPK
mgnify:CR=1 FL=1